MFGLEGRRSPASRHACSGRDFRRAHGDITARRRASELRSERGPREFGRRRSASVQTLSRLSRGGLRCPAFYVVGYDVPPLTRRATLYRLLRGGLRCPASHEAGYAVPPFTWWAFLFRLSRGGLRCPAFYVVGFSVPPLTRRATLSRFLRGGLFCPASHEAGYSVPLRRRGVLRKRGHETEGVGSGAGARGGRAMDRRGAALLAMTIHWGMTGVPSGLSSMTS